MTTLPDLPETDSLTSQLFELASTLHGAGLLEDAEEQYRLLLRHDPQHAAALHYLGLLMHQTGRDEEACGHVEQASALLPHQADWRNDQGNMHFARERYDQAAAAYEAALALRPRDAQIWTNLGAAQRAQNKDDDAVLAFRQALEIAPEYAPAMLQLAEIYKQRGDRMLSSRYECMAYVLPPHAGKSRELLSLSLYFLGRIEEAAQVCHAWLQEEPEHPKARHMHAAYAGLNPSTASPLYVQAHFDDYAATFDQNLVQHLQYRGPQVLGELLHVLLGDARRALDVLDAGCGTGLCAPILAAHASSLEGVDLSAGMLEQANRRGLYTHLARCDAAEWMRRHAQRYDLVCACDVLIYVGDLTGFLASAQRTLRTGGYLFFTVELADESSADAFFLHPSGRFRHTRRYVEEALQAAGLALLVMHEESLRLECGAPVSGLVCLAMA